MTSRIDPETRIGLVSLSVADLDRSLRYYQHNIGLSVLDRHQDSAQLGVDTTPLLQLYEVRGARLTRRATGLYHFALRVPSRRDLARVIRHFAETNTRINGVSDHLVSEALYLSDLDGHGIEIYRDRPRSTWYDANGAFRMDNAPLDFADIMNELDANEPGWDGIAASTDMGHIHLQVADVGSAERFYVDVIGLERMISMSSASFVSAGEYHHHIGMNSWAGVGVPAPPADAARLLNYELVVPTIDALNDVLDRVHNAGVQVAEQVAGWAVRDPSHNVVVLRAEG